MNYHECVKMTGGRVCNSYRDYSVGSDAHFHLLMELILKTFGGHIFHIQNHTKAEFMQTIFAQ